MRERKLPNERKKQLLDSAVELSKKIGYNKITRDGVANHAGVSYSLISSYFKTIHNLKKLVLKKSIRDEVVEILAQAMACKDPLVSKLNRELKDKVIHYLSS